MLRYRGSQLGHVAAMVQDPYDSSSSWTCLWDNCQWEYAGRLGDTRAWKVDIDHQFHANAYYFLFRGVPRDHE